MNVESETGNLTPPATDPTTTTTSPSLITATPPNDPPADPPSPDDPPKDPSAPEAAPAPEPLTADDITFAEGFTVDETLRDELLATLNDREKSPKELAQSLVDLQQKASQKLAEQVQSDWEATQTRWRDEVKADPEIGGDKLQPTLARIQRLNTEYGSPELLEVFDSTGAGNHPALIRFLSKVADKLVESEAVPGSPTTQRGDAASRLFPSMKG